MDSATRHVPAGAPTTAALSRFIDEKSRRRCLPAPLGTIPTSMVESESK